LDKLERLVTAALLWHRGIVDEAMFAAEMDDLSKLPREIKAAWRHGARLRANLAAKRQELVATEGVEAADQAPFCEMERIVVNLTLKPNPNPNLRLSARWRLVVSFF